ncbi:FtsX-like permease family protein [Caloramator sp. E03]|uniref:ABC transporter permease n=1 Tax=Caloramator sp. E03 TaxID=2576307 RepID=UPI001110E676|nr:ABC transporter permease [Caloramator sp. E03]QCX33444.1 FtsX-like permease family protein [Caloramator sp. E03]
MNLMESTISALRNIKTNKMRSLLTMLGIIIGISSVITIVSLGQGAKKYITGQFESIGTNVINVQVKSMDKDVESSDYFTLDDAKILKEKISNIDFVVPFTEGFGRLKSESKSKQAQIIGTNEYYPKISNLEILYGRFLNDHDIQTQKNVAVIDDLSVKKLFKTQNPVGKQIKINIQNNSLNVTIIGVVKNPSGNMAAAFGDNFPGFVFLPITISDRIMVNTDISQMSVMLKDMTNSTETASQITRLLEIRHRSTGKYAASEGFKELDMINNILNTLTLVIGAIAAISLIVGGIGVMNIMLVSVTERTREIGIRKAIGAKQKDIRIQFLTESLILCLMGGIIGMILGVLFGRIAGSLIHVTAVISVQVVLIAFLFSSAVGIFFGLYPADKAAKLDPIEALRYE